MGSEMCIRDRCEGGEALAAGAFVLILCDVDDDVLWQALPFFRKF